jgi:RNA polymerase sigma factor (TIGR02999 family)
LTFVVTISSQTGITQLLDEVRVGDQAAVDTLFERVYKELRGMAADYLRRERPDHTLQATALVHEAYLRLVGDQDIEWQNRAHFFGVAAQVMRHILVDHARKHRAEKRGSGEGKVSLDEAVDFFAARDVNLVALDDALKTLETLHRQQSQIVELKFFGGLSIAEIAEVMDISNRTVNRDWLKARMWLHSQLVQGIK